MGGARLLKLWDSVPEGPFSSLGTLTNEAERTLDLPRRRSRHGSSPWLSTEQLLGPFEEEEEGTGIGSDVVKVKGEDPATPDLLP